MARLSNTASASKAPDEDEVGKTKAAKHGDPAADQKKKRKEKTTGSSSSSSSRKTKGEEDGKSMKKRAPPSSAMSYSTSPAVRLVDLRADTALKMASARARLGEKLVCARASMRVAIVRLRHPVHPVHRVAASEAAHETRAAAMQRREQRIAKARIVASHKKALARERRAHELKHSVATI